MSRRIIVVCLLLLALIFVAYSIQHVKCGRKRIYASAFYRYDYNSPPPPQKRLRKVSIPVTLGKGKWKVSVYVDVLATVFTDRGSGEAQAEAKASIGSIRIGVSVYAWKPGGPHDKADSGSKSDEITGPASGTLYVYAYVYMLKGEYRDYVHAYAEAMVSWSSAGDGDGGQPPPPPPPKKKAKVIGDVEPDNAGRITVSWYGSPLIDTSTYQVYYVSGGLHGELTLRVKKIKEGYTFEGWYVNGKYLGNKTTVKIKVNLKPGNTLTIKACFKKRKYTKIIHIYYKPENITCIFNLLNESWSLEPLLNDTLLFLNDEVIQSILLLKVGKYNETEIVEGGPGGTIVKTHPLNITVHGNTDRLRLIYVNASARKATFYGFEGSKLLEASINSTGIHKLLIPGLSNTFIATLSDYPELASQNYTVINGTFKIIWQSWKYNGTNITGTIIISKVYPELWSWHEDLETCKLNVTLKWCYNNKPVKARKLACRILEWPKSLIRVYDSVFEGTLNLKLLSEGSSITLEYEVLKLQKATMKIPVHLAAIVVYGLYNMTNDYSKWNITLKLVDWERVSKTNNYTLPGQTILIEIIDKKTKANTILKQTTNATGYIHTIITIPYKRWEMYTYSLITTPVKDIIYLPCRILLWTNTI